MRRGRSGSKLRLAFGVLAATLLLPSGVVAAEPAAAATTRHEAESATISQGAVEANHAGFSGTGFVNYDNVIGSYVEFTVNAATAGPASLTFRFANGTTANRPMDVMVNGTAAADEVGFQATGTWTTWQTVTVNTSLRAGTNTIRATATTANGGPNLDALDVEVRAAADFQAEDATVSQGVVESNHAGFTGTGFVNYDNVAGSYVEFSVTAAEAGETGLIFRFANGTTGNRPMDITVNGTVSSPNVAFAGSGSWTNWQEVTVNANLRAGANTIRATATGASGGPNLDRLRVGEPGTGGGNNPGTPAQVSGNWTIPWDIAWAPDGSFALGTERDDFGVFRVNKNGTGKTRVGSVPNSQTTGGEGGLMGVAFSPTWNGTTDQEVFFMHTSSDGNRVAKMTFNGSSLSGYTVLVNGIAKNRFHNGGRIEFGPDGFLYVTTGDAQNSNLAQDRDSLNGKILRVTKTGAAAPGNPFNSRIYSYGHRNPQGLAWDDAGRLWSSELGPSGDDELNLIRAGGNYGWPVCTGTGCSDPMIDAKHTWSPAEASPSGLAFANGALFMAALRGERLWRIVLDGENVSTVTSHFRGTFGRLRAVAKVPGEDAIWIGTTNADNNGGEPDGSDRILRSNLS